MGSPCGTVGGTGEFRRRPGQRQTASGVAVRCLIMPAMFPPVACRRRALLFALQPVAGHVAIAFVLNAWSLPLTDVDREPSRRRPEKWHAAIWFVAHP